MPVHYWNTLSKTLLCLWVRGLEMDPEQIYASTSIQSDVTCIRCIDAMNEVF